MLWHLTLRYRSHAFLHSGAHSHHFLRRSCSLHRCPSHHPFWIDIWGRVWPSYRHHRINEASLVWEEKGVFNDRVEESECSPERLSADVCFRSGHVNVPMQGGRSQRNCPKIMNNVEPPCCHLYAATQSCTTFPKPRWMMNSTGCDRKFQDPRDIRCKGEWYGAPSTVSNLR